MPSAKCKLFYKTNNKKAKHKAAIEKADMNILLRYFSNSLEDPVKLQEFVWFNLCFHLGRTGREGWRELQKEHFKILTNAENHRYVTIVALKIILVGINKALKTIAMSKCMKTILIH